MSENKERVSEQLKAFLDCARLAQAPKSVLAREIDEIDPVSIEDSKTRQLVRIWQGRNYDESILPALLDELQGFYLTMPD